MGSMGDVRFFQVIGWSFSEIGGPQDDMKKRKGWGLKNFDALKIMFNVRSVSFGAKREFYERVAVPTVTFGAEK